MKRLLIVFAAAVLGLGLAACKQQDKSAESAAPAVDGKVVATVNQQKITEPVFQAYLDRQSRGGRVDLNPEQRQQLLNQVVNIELLSQNAVDQGLDKDSDTAVMLAIQRSQTLANAAIQKYLTENPITDKDVKAAYEKRVKDMPKKEYKARHILVKTKQEAQDIIDQLNSGTPFKQLVGKSIEPNAAQRGGDLGWFSPDKMVKPFSDAVEQMKKGSHSKVPVKTQFGWHVIQLEDVRDAPVPTLDDMKSQLRSMLRRQEIENYINDLRGKAKIDIKESAEPEADKNEDESAEKAEKAGDADEDADKGEMDGDQDDDEAPTQ